MKDSKECLHNVVKYNERDSHEDIYNTKEVPSNGLSDTNLIVRKSRPPERVKWINWISRNKVAMMSLVVICLGQFSGNEPLLHPVLHPTVETAVNGTNKDAGGGGGGPNVVTIISAVITTSLALVSIVFLVVKCIVPCLHKRRQLSFPWQKSSTSSSAADNDAHCRMITTASKPESESAECC